MKFFKFSLRAEKGQGLAIVLAFLALGSLVVATSVQFATTNLKANKNIKEDMEGQYAAAAGVEYSIWYLQQETEFNGYLGQQINGLQVEIGTVLEGIFTVYLDDLVEPDPGVHYDWLVLKSNIELVGGSTANYTLSVNRTADASGVIRLIELGIKLPTNYTYVNDSVDFFPNNISSDNPDESGFTSGGDQYLKWLWGPGKGPEMTGNHTQGVYIEGAGGFGGSYGWVVSQSQDIGAVGEITGELFSISSVARNSDNSSIVGIEAEVMEVGGDIYILSWEITSY